MIEQMITEAVLRDNFTPVLRKIAKEQDDYARRTSALNTAGNVALGIGGALTALTAKAIKQAAAYQQSEAAFKGMLGSAEAGKEMFKELTQFTVKTPFQLADWTKATQTLLGFGVAAKDIHQTLEGLGNSEASLGRTGADLQRAAYELGEMNSGFISMKQIRALISDGVPAAQLLRKELHLTGEQLAKIGTMHISGKVGVAAILKGTKEGSLANGMEEQMQTLNGSVTSLKDNWNLFLAQVGQPSLRPLTHLAQEASELLGSFQKLPIETQKAFGTIVPAGAALWLVGGGIAKTVSAYMQYQAALKTVKMAGDAERAGEKAKVGIAEAESLAVGKSSRAYKEVKIALGGATEELAESGRAAVTAESKWAAFGGTVSGLIGKLGQFAKAARLAYIGLSLFDIGKSFLDERDPKAKDRNSYAYDYNMFRKNQWARDGDDVLHPGNVLTHAFKNWTVDEKTYARFQAEARRIIKDNGDNADLAKFDKLNTGATVKNWRKLSDEAITKQAESVNALVQKSQEYHDSGQAATDALAKAQKEYGPDLKFSTNDPDKFKLPAQLDYKLQYDQRHIDLLEAEGNQQKKINALKADEIKLHRQAEAALRAAAKQATTEDEKYKLLGQADEQAVEAKKLGLKDKSSGKSAMDKLTTRILGGASEDELIKAGLNRAMFRRMGAGKLPTDPLKAALLQLKKRPIEIHFSINDKVVQTIKTSVEDDLVKQLTAALTGSSSHAMLGAH